MTMPAQFPALQQRGLAKFIKLALDFSANETLDPRITFSRTSNATRVNAQGLIEYAPHNLLTYSENFDNAVWVKSPNATATANVVTAPDGTITCDKISYLGSSTAPQQTVSSLTATYSFSAFVKKGNTSFCRLRLGAAVGGSGTSLSVHFNIDTGVVSAVGAATADFGAITATITQAANGFYRISITFTVLTATTSITYSIIAAQVSGGGSSNGDEIYIWGAQLNIGSLQPYYTTSVKNLLGYSQNFENAAWTKSNSSVLTNLLTYSQEFDNAAWVKSNSSISATKVTAPDGSITGQKLVEDNTSNLHYSIESISATSGTRYVYSLYAKAGERTNIQLYFSTSNGIFDSTNAANSVVFDLTNGVATAGASITAFSITSVGNGWYRCMTSRSASATGSGAIGIIMRDAYSISTSGYAGDGTSGIYIWGAQLVQGTDPGEYTVTTSAAAPIQVMGPLGFVGAEKLVEDTATSTHSIQQTPTTDDASVFTASLYCKAGEKQYVQLRISDTSPTSGSRAYATFDLLNGTYNVGSITATNVTANIILLDSGWYRCTLTCGLVVTGTTTLSHIYIANSATASSAPPSYTGDGTSGIYIFGAQLSDSASLDQYSYNFGAAPTSTAYYGPRFDYDPVTLAPKGLLIEEARTNLLTYSQEFDNAVWVKTNATVSSNTTIAPDGATTGDTLLSVAAGGDTGIRFTTAQSNSTVYTASIYAKYTNTRYLVIRNLAIGATLNEQWTFFDLLNGTVGTKPANVTAVITPVGGGWYKCSVSATTLATIINDFLDYRLSTTDNAYSVLNTSTINIWGAQLEAGSFPTSYIPTTSAQVTRAADNASMVGTNFSSWYNQSEGTVVCSSDSPQTTSTAEINWYLTNNAADNTMFNRKNTSNTISSAVVVNNVAQGDIVSGTTISANAPAQSAFSYKLNDLAISVNGAAVGTDSLANIPFVEKLCLGANPSAGQVLNGHIQSFKFFSKRFLNTYLQSLTE